MTQHMSPHSEPSTNSPGKTLGVVGLVLAFVVSIAGIVVSAVGLHESRQAGQQNPLAVAGLALSITFTAIQLFGVILAIVLFSVLWSSCGTLGPGVHMMGNGGTINCNL